MLEICWKAPTAISVCPGVHELVDRKATQMVRIQLSLMVHHGRQRGITALLRPNLSVCLHILRTICTNV